MKAYIIIYVVMSELLVWAMYFSHGKPRKSGFEFLVPLQPEDNCEILLSHMVIQESIIADLLKAFGKHMHKEACLSFSPIAPKSVT